MVAGVGAGAWSAAGCGPAMDDPVVTTGADPVVPHAAAPVSLQIPSLGVQTELEQLALAESGELESPVDPDRAGWYADGPAPGDLGPAVIAGHVDSRDGPAVFYRLATMSEGDRIVVARADGSTVAFRVESVASYPKDQFPTTGVYGATPEPTLRLITCGGVFDRGARSYEDNVVVFAVAE